MDQPASFYVSGSPPPEPKMVELMNLVRVADPYKLGVQLKINEADLNIMRANHPNNHGRQLEDVFGLYLNQTEDPSWIGVVKALHAIREIKCAKSIMKKFGISKTVPSSSPHSDTQSEYGQTEEDDSKPSRKVPIKAHPKTQNYLCSFSGCVVISLFLVVILGAVGYVAWIKPMKDLVTDSFPTTKPSTSLPHKSTREKPAESPVIEEENWLTEEPTIKLLSLIKYTNSKGEKEQFRLIKDIQTHCRALGTRLGIELPRIDSLEKKHRDSTTDFCTAIFEDWKNRGEGKVSWGGLLEALEDIELGGIGKDLRKALILYFYRSRDEL